MSKPIANLLEEKEIRDFLTYMKACNLNLDYFQSVFYFATEIYFKDNICPLSYGVLCNDFISDCNEIITGNCAECIYVGCNQNGILQCSKNHSFKIYFKKLTELSMLFDIQQDEHGQFIEYSRRSEKTCQPN